MQRHATSSLLAVLLLLPTSNASANFFDRFLPGPIREGAKKVREATRNFGDRVRKDIKKAGDKIRDGVKKLKDTAGRVVKGARDFVERARQLLRKGLAMGGNMIRSVIALVKCLGGAARKMFKPGGGPPLQAMAKLAKDVVTDLFKFAKSETLDLFKPNADDVRVMNVKGTFGKYVDRMGNFAKKTPVGACFFAFAQPMLKGAAKHVEKLANMIIPQLKSIWKNVLEPKVQGLIKHGITQALAVFAGEEAERILAEQVVKHIFNLEHIKAGAEKVGALAEAVGSGQGIDTAAAETREALKKKDFSRARFVFDVFASLVRFKTLEFIGRGCSGKEGTPIRESTDGNKTGSSGWFKDEGMSWFKQPGMMLNKGVAALESRIPGGACLIDYGFKGLETVLTTVRSVLDAVCNAGADAVSSALIAAYGAGAVTLAARIAGGVTAACSLVLNFVEEVARGTVIPAMKAQAQGAVTTIVTKILDKGTDFVRKGLGRAFDKVDEVIKRLVLKTGEFGKFVQRMLDGALIAFIDSRGQRFLDVIEKYNARLVDLTNAVEAVSKGGK